MMLSNPSSGGMAAVAVAVFTSGTQTSIAQLLMIRTVSHTASTSFFSC
jgi:hypothetical protein